MQEEMFSSYVLELFHHITTALTTSVRLISIITSPSLMLIC